MDKLKDIKAVRSSEDILVWAEQDGVDLSLLRERLQLTPTERLRRHEGALALVEALRDAKRKDERAPDRVAAHRTGQG